MQTAWIISCGTELVLGQTVDTNAAWLARQLAGLGLRCTRHVTVPDEPAAIKATLLEAARAADLIVTTGGLGPTADDLTREALAAASGDELVSDPRSLEHIRGFFAARGREMPAANEVQALRPSRARALDNPIGTAPGLLAMIHGKPCYALPGVPAEMRELFGLHVDPGVRALSGGRVIRSRMLHCFGAGESDVGAKISDLMARGANPEVGTTVSAGVVSIRINAAGASPEEAEALLAGVEEECRTRLGELIFGRDEQTLGAVVGEQLAAGGKTVAAAESCTGGLLGKLLTDVPGSSRYFVGGLVAYSNEVKQELLGVPPGLIDQHGAVSAPVAEWMASAARERFRASFGLSITGIAGPGGGTAEKPVGLVWVGLSHADGVQSHERRFGANASREMIRLRAALTSLDRLRHYLLERA